MIVIVAAITVLATFVDESIDTRIFIAAILVGAVSGALGVYNPTDTATFTLENAVSAALVFSGHPIAAVATVVAGQVVGALRRYLVPHLLLLNIVQFTCEMLACHAVFQAVAHGHDPGSMQWTLGTALGIAALLTVTFIGVMGFDLLTGMMPLRESADMCFEDVRITGTIGFGMAIMASTLVNTWVGPFALAIPLLFEHIAYSNTARAMRAVSESLTDPLTGLGNRRSFDMNIGEFVEGRDVADTYGLFLDLDNFKRLNDTRGHDEGDRALRLAAQTVLANIRQADLACRIGGEEFVVVTREIEQVDAMRLAERIRTGIEHALRDLDVTVSIGLVNYRTGEPLAEFVRRGDEAMYRAKRSGKNRVEADLEPRLRAA